MRQHSPEVLVFNFEICMESARKILEPDAASFQ